MTQINTFNSAATVEIKDGRTTAKFNLDELIEAVVDKVLEKLEAGNERIENKDNDIGLELDTEIARNLAKVSKLASLTKSESDNSQAYELINEARLKIKLANDLGSSELAEEVFEQSQELIADISILMDKYNTTEEILNRSIFKKVLNRGNNQIDQEDHANQYSELIDKQLRFRNLLKQARLSPKLIRELVSLIPYSANQLFESYKKSLDETS